jgi:hypothetical protein
MNELLLYAEYEAGHPIFRFMRDMRREANALEGKMQALRVLMEVSDLFHRILGKKMNLFNSTDRLSWSGSEGKAILRHNSAD